MARGFAVILLIWVTAWCPTRAAEPSAGGAAITLDVVVSSPRLPAMVAGVMKEEAARIWTREGVEIVWRDHEMEVPRDHRFVHLTLIDDEDRPHRKEERYVLGDFQPDESRIRISLFAAARAANSSTAPLNRSRGTFDYPVALGYVLGRAIAHEVGHALLGAAHANAGLMSAAFNPGMMADALSDQFRLTSAESKRLSGLRFDDRSASRRPLTAGHASLAVTNVLTLPTR